MPNFIALFSRRPEIFVAWRALLAAIRADMDDRRYELATVAAAKQLRSSYCVLAHGSVLMDKFMGADEFQAIVTDHRVAGLDDVDVAVMDLAEKIADDAGTVTPADIDSAYAELDPGLREAMVVGRPIETG